MTYYHQAKCLLLICRHAHGNARAEFKALGTDDPDQPGFDCIDICRDVKMWEAENLNEQTFQPFLDIANDAFNELKMSKDRLDEELRSSTSNERRSFGPKPSWRKHVGWRVKVKTRR
jgi:hypothetical protein